MSPEWQSQAPTAEQRAGSGSATVPTPPNTAGFVSQQSGVGAVQGVSSEQQTPASDSVRVEGDGDVEMVNGDGSGVAGAVNDSSMAGVAAADAEHRRTDHERQSESHTTTNMLPPPAPLLYKLRKESKFALRMSHCVLVY